MHTTQPAVDETRVLRPYVDELALSTLAAAWGRSDVGEIAEGRGVERCRARPLALVSVRVSGRAGTASVEAACGPQGPEPPSPSQTGQWLLDVRRGLAVLPPRG